MKNILTIVILSTLFVAAASAATPQQRADRALAALAKQAAATGHAVEARALESELATRRTKGFAHGYALGYQMGYADGLAGRYVDHTPAHGDPQNDPFYRGYEEGYLAATFPRP